MSVPEYPAFDSGKRPPKPHLKISEQLALLASRGMKISNPDHAADCLRRIGYYRLSGYWKPFQADPGGKSEQFAPGASFPDILALYVFDKRLRLILLDAQERIEIALRIISLPEVADGDCGLRGFARARVRLNNSADLNRWQGKTARCVAL